ncbi:uncharacterized protein LOC144615232 isoform X5 [Panthera onca]
MSRLRLLAPLLLFMWQPLWLLVQAAQPPEWALDPAQLTSDPLEAAEPWSSHSSDPPPESPQALTPPAEPGGFNYLGSSAPAQMLAPPKELTETLVPLLDTDSFGELPPGPDEDLNDQLTQHQRLPEVVPVPGWDQNQTIAPPPHLKSKTKTVGLDQAEDHQSFDSNMGLLYPEENLPMGFPGGPDQLPNFSEEAEIPPPLQKTPHHLESPEEAESFLPQGEAQAQHPEPSEETEPSLLEQEAPSQRPESLKDGNSANPQEAPAEPSSTPEEVEPSSVQQEASAHPTEAPEEVEPSPTPQEAPAQPPEPSKDIISQLLAHHEVNVLSPSQSEAQKPSFPNVTVKPLDLTITLTQPAEHPEEAGPTPVQQEAPAQPAERLEEVEPTPVQQEAPPQPAERLEEVEPTPVQQEAPTLVPEFPIEYLTQLAVSDEVTSLPLGQYPDYLMFPRVIGKPLDVEFTTTPGPDKGVESSIAQQEAPPQPLEHTEEAELSLTQQETSGKPPEEVEPSSEQETPGQPSEPPGVIDPSLRQQETPAQPSVPPEEGKPSLSKQEPPAQLPDRFGEAELSPTQEEALAQLAELLNEAESSTQQETPAQSPGEIESSATLQEQPAQPPELPSREVEPSPTQQEHPAQPLWHHKMTVSPPGHYHDQHLNLPNVSVKPPDVQLTMTAEPTTEVGPSAVRHETIAQPSVPLNVEPFETQHEAPTLPPQSPEVESLPVQQETPTQSPESTTQEKLPTQQETPVQYPEYPGEVEPSTTQQEALAQQSQAPEEGESSSTQEEAPTQLPEAQEEGEPSPLQEEGQGQHPQASEGSEPPTTQEESPAQHPQTPEEVESSTQQEAPAQYPQASEEGEPFPTQPETPTQYPEPLEGTEPSPAQSKATTQHPNPLGEVKPATYQEAPSQHPQTSEEINPSATQQEATAQHPEPSGEVEPSPTQQEAPAHSPEHQVVTVFPQGQNQAQLLLLPNVTVKPVDSSVTMTSESTNEVEASPLREEASAQSAVSPEQLEPSPIQQEVPHQHPAAPENVESSPVQHEVSTPPEDFPEEIELSPSQQESSALPQVPVASIEPSPIQQEVPAQQPKPNEGVESFPVQYEHPAQPPGSSTDVVAQSPVQHEVTFSPPGPGEDQHPVLPNITGKPVDLRIFLSPQATKEVKHLPVQQDVPAQSPIPPEKVEFAPAQSKHLSQSPESPEDESSPGQQEVLAQTPDPPKAVDPASGQQEAPAQSVVPQLAPAQPSEPPEKVEPSPVQQEVPAQPSEPPNEAESSPTPQEALVQSPVPQQAPAVSPEPPKEVEPSPTLQEAPAQPSEPPNEAESPTQQVAPAQFPVLQESPAISPEPPKEVEPSPTPQEPPAQPSEPGNEAESFPTQQGAPVVSPEPPKEVEPSTQQEAPPQPSDPPEKVEPSPVQQETLSLPLEPLKEIEPSLTQQEVQAQPSEAPEKVEPSPILQQSPTQPPEPSKEAETPPAQQEAPVQPPEPPEEVVAQPPVHNEVTVPPLGQEQAQHPNLPNVTVQPADLELTVTPEPTVEAEQSTIMQQTLAPPEDTEVTPPHPEQVQAQHPNLTEVRVQPLDLELTITPEPTTEVETSTTQEIPGHPSEPPKEVVVQPPLFQEVTVPTPGLDQARHPSSPNVTVQPLDLVLTVTTEPTTDVKHSSALQQTTAPPKDLEVTFPHSEHIQHPTLTKVTVKPLDPGLTVTPESTTETEPSLTMQETPTQPPEPPKEVVQYPSQQEVTVPTPSKDQGQQPTLPSVTAHRVDLGLTITPEPTTEAEHSTPVKETTAPPPKDLEVTLAHPEQVQSQHPNLTEVTVPPMDLELTVTAGSSVETEPSPTMRDTPTQPPEPPKEVVVQYPFQQEVTVPTPSKDQGQHPASPIIPFRHVELTITPEPITEAEHSTTLKKTTTPPPKDLEVTLAHPKQVQSQHRNLTEVTVPPMDLEIPVSQQPESFETGFPPTTEHPVVHFVKYTSEKAYTTLTWQPEQNATTDLKICERCTCKEETLSCVGLSPQQRLRRVPVLEPDTYNGTFTILNFQGNSISHIDENVWKGYRWAEKLIISRNPLSTVEDSYLFKLPALKYLDMGSTQVSLTTVESILMMTVELETLILPSRMACCLCQFKNTIEVVCKTVKLRCDSACLTNGTRCDQEVYLRKAEGSFMKVLTARKKSASTELTIEPEKASSDIDRVSLSAFMNEQLDFNDESDVISALNYILPYFSEGTLEDVESTLLPFIKLLFSNVQEGDKPVGHSMNDTGDPSLKPGSNNSTYKNKLRKLYFLENLVDAEIQEKIDDVKKKEKMAMLIHSSLLGPKFKRQIFPKKLETAQPQEKSLDEVESVGKKFLRVKKVIKGPKGIPKRHLKELRRQNIQRKQSAQPSVENMAKERRLRRPSPGELPVAHRPSKLVGSSFNTEPSFIDEHKAAVSSLMKQYFLDRPSATPAPKERRLRRPSPGELPVAHRPSKLVGSSFNTEPSFIDEHKAAVSSLMKQYFLDRPSATPAPKERRLRRPSPGELPVAHRPSKLVGSSFNTEPSFVDEHKAAVSSFLRQYSLGRPSATPAPKSPPDVKKESKDLTYTIFVLEDANARVRNMKAFRPASLPRKTHRFHKSRSRVVHRTPKAKLNRKSRKESSLSNRQLLAKRPPSSAVRSLINSPSREDFSSPGELSPQKNPFPELFAPSGTYRENTTVENTTAQNVSEENISTGNTTMPEQTLPEFTDRKNLSTANSTVTADNSMPTVKQTNDTQREYHNAGTGLPPKATGFTVSKLSSSGDLFEIQLNQQLQSLIPSNDVRRLISHVIRTLKMDCSETQVQLACAKLISRTGLLMKLLSEQQEVKVSKAEWDTDQWKNENYINESTEVQSEQREQESRELTKEVPGYGYNNKLILAISVTVVVMILIIVFCLIEIYSHRTAAKEGKEGSSRGFFGSLLRKRCSEESDNQEGFFWRRRPLWLRDMYRPLNATRKKNMAQKLHDKDSSDEDEIFNMELGEAGKATAEKTRTTDSTTEELGDESETACEIVTE